MNKPARQPPRFVPTLTEMVDPLESNADLATPDAAVEALVREVWLRVQPALSRQVRAESEHWVRATMAQHLQAVHARMQVELESRVREAVMDALKSPNRADPDVAHSNI
jgi:hypothetical protein